MVLNRILLGLLLSAMMIAPMGVPIFAIQLVMCVILVFLTTKKNVENKDKGLLLLISLLVFIDKVNDLWAVFDFLRHIGPIIYCYLLSRYLLTKKYTSSNCDIVFMYRISILAVLLAIIINYTQGIEYRAYSSDVSTLLMFIWILNMWYGKHKFLFTGIIVFLTIFTFEARTMILSMAAFILYISFGKNLC